jgi:hypothetical protein
MSASFSGAALINRVVSGRVNQRPARHARPTAAEVELISNDRISPPGNPAEN